MSRLVRLSDLKRTSADDTCRRSASTALFLPLTPVCYWEACVVSLLAEPWRLAALMTAQVRAEAGRGRFAGPPKRSPGCAN